MMTQTGIESKVVSVNDLEMDGGLHGEGEPLVLVHGGLQTIDLMSEFVAALVFAVVPTTPAVLATPANWHGVCNLYL